LHLKGRRLAVAERIAEVEIAVLLAARKGSTVLELETGRLHGVEHPGFFDEVQAMAQQTFADGEAREQLTLDNQHVVALAFEQGCRN
ncbi:hypothetical protein OFN56_36525, partial [Escherichia coli]|nr:hypothetical protein [Escherichia coli]